MPGPRYLLDTNVLSALVKQPAGPVADRIRAVGEDGVCTSIVVACELRYGCAKKGSPALTSRVEQLLSTLEVLPLGPNADEEYGRLRATLERQGTPIGANDCLIAAHALSLGLILVTDNLGEFSRVSGLRLESWLEN